MRHDRFLRFFYNPNIFPEKSQLWGFDFKILYLYKKEDEEKKTGKWYNQAPSKSNIQQRLDVVWLIHLHVLTHMHLEKSISWTINC